MKKTLLRQIIREEINNTQLANAIESTISKTEYSDIVLKIDTSLINGNFQGVKYFTVEFVSNINVDDFIMSYNEVYNSFESTPEITDYEQISPKKFRFFI